MKEEKVGKLIKDIRKQNNLTQEEFASLFGVTYQAVSKWENGKNMPDIAILKEICNRYNIDINDFLEGKQRKINKKNYIIIIITTIIILLILSLIFFFWHRDSFEFKMIGSNCREFNINGSIAYNQSKSSIYISHIDYCGDFDKNIYTKIECSLYEKNDDIIKKIDDEVKENSNGLILEDYLKDMTFMINDYNQICKNYTENSLYLELKAYDKNNNQKTYQIPLKFEKNC